MNDTAIEKAKIAYALWRKRERDSRQTGAAINIVLAGVSIAAVLAGLAGVGWVMGLAVLPLGLIGLISLFESTRIEQIPSWSELISEYEYESWKLTQETRKP